jgi:FtsP/CotA-like multicopper oxidase with cupredoxin domain
MKRVLLAVLAAAVLVVMGIAGGGAVLYIRADASNLGTLEFENELEIPPLLTPREEHGRLIFDLELQTGRIELVPGKQAETWGANGSYLSPTLRAEQGDRVEVRVRNELPEQTTIHWHGMHLPAVADGGPHQTIGPGETWGPSWEIDQPAATLWYHPHPHGETSDHVYRGIAGMFIVDDPEADSLPLPDTYGIDDIPLIIQDKRINDDGSLDLSERIISPTGRLGDTILVNGTYDPYLRVRHQRIRLRLLNASDARVYNVGFVDGREFDLVATDGGLLETPQQLSRIQLSPGERAEIVAAFEEGEEVVLRSFEPDLGTNFFEGRFAGSDDRFDLLQFRAAPILAPSPEVPERLSEHEQLREEDAVRTRRFELDSTSINGKDLDVGRIDEVVEVDSTELWEVHNASGTPHSFHPHGLSFRVLEDGEALPAELSGWKDTVYVPPGETMRLVLRSPNRLDPTVPFMYHCHVLQHEDRGMMGQFVVVERGQAGQTRVGDFAN